MDVQTLDVLVFNGHLANLSGQTSRISFQRRSLVIERRASGSNARLGCPAKAKPSDPGSFEVYRAEVLPGGELC